MAAPYPMDIPKLDDMIRRYLDGESARSIANEFGISDSTLRDRLKKRGVKLRSRNDYPAHVEAAHAARRGQVESADLLEKRAIGRQQRVAGVSFLEVEVGRLLTARGVDYTPQLAVGPYNIDLAIERGSVAVEVIGGGYRSRTRARLPQRRKYLLDRGWHLIEVRRKRGTTDFVGADDHIVAFLDFSRSNPSAPREYRVIRSDGQLVSACRGDAYKAA